MVLDSSITFVFDFDDCMNRKTTLNFNHLISRLEEQNASPQTLLKIRNNSQVLQGVLGPQAVP